MIRFSKFTLVGVAILCAASLRLEAQDATAPADTSYWKKKTEFGANFNQGSFSTNWAGGGVNSIALGFVFNALGEYKKGKDSWRNDFQTQYGLVKNRGQESRKNADRIFFDSKYGRQLTDKWSFIANVNFLSQLAPGYMYSTGPDNREVAKKISNIFSPAFITESVGLEYKPVPYFFVSFAPGAVRQTIVADRQLYVNTPDQRNYGVPIGRSVRNEVALMQIVANFDKNIAENVNLKWRYMMFANYRELNAIDHRIDAMLTAKVNKYLNVNLGAIVLFDKDQSAAIQFAQTLALGFLYTF